MARRVSVADAQRLIADGNIDIIDVRESHEWMTGHVPGARHLPLGQLTADPAKLGPRVLFVCESGNRSQRAADIASAHGVQEAYSLDGGTRGWKAANLPIESPSVAPDDDIAPELSALVAENLKALRTREGYTLDTLAGLSGVGRQTLGQIELGQTMPSLGTLWKIARAFDVPFASLLARQGASETRIFRAATARKIVDADGRFSSRALFHPEDTNGAYEFYELWLAGYGREDAEPHAHGTRENLVVVSGRLVLEVGAARYELAKGDAIAFNADVRHSYINPGAEECTMNLVMIYRAQK